MLGLLLSILAFAFFAQVTLAADQLVFAQALWRHGDRTPLSTYKNDPYQEDFWGLPWGELTTRGMKQSFLQGQRLKKRLIDQYGLVSAKYEREQVALRSAATPRCIQSALANLAGFYGSSNGTHPTDVPEWPATWTPVPVHSKPADEDPELEPAKKCMKADELYAERVLHKEFLEFIASKWMLFTKIMKHTGDTLLMEFKGLVSFYGSVKIERDYYHLKMPDWVTDDLYNDLEETVEAGMDFVEGAAGFNHGADTHLIRLRGGFLLSEWLANFERAVGGGGHGEKYKVYSAHDDTVSALLNTLGAKGAVVGAGRNPEYAAAVLGELWKKDDGKYYVQFLYSADSATEFVPFTRHITGCPADSDFCPIQTFADRSKNFLAKDHEKECSLL